MIAELKKEAEVLKSMENVRLKQFSKILLLRFKKG